MEEENTTEDFLEQSPAPQMSSSNMHEEEILFNFNKLSIQEMEISLQQLETIIMSMREKSISTIPLSDLLIQLGVQNKSTTTSAPISVPVSAPPPVPPPASKSESVFTSPKCDNHHHSSNETVTPPKSASSISSSIPSTWSTTPFQASPIQFNFQTPQKIFVFGTKETPKVEQKNNDVQFPPEVEPPIIDPPGVGISKSLFIDLTDESGEESNTGPSFGTTTTFSSATFSLGAAPSNKNGKLSKRGNKKTDNPTSSTITGTKQKVGNTTHTIFTSTLPNQINQPQSQPQPPSQPFTFGSLFTGQSGNVNGNGTGSGSGSSNGNGRDPQSTNINTNSQPVAPDNNVADNDDHMEIGHTDEIPIQNMMPNVDPQQNWKLPVKPQPFGSQQSTTDTNFVEPDNNQQLPKKKLNSTIKRKLRSQKKAGDKDNISKLDNIFANISLQPNFQEHDDNPPQAQPQPSSASFIFFPPPPTNPTNDTNSSTQNNSKNNNTTEQSHGDDHFTKPSSVGGENQRENSADNRKIQMAEIFKREGKDMYSLQRYDMAYQAFTKCLKAAPSNWQDRSNILSNRAAALIMMERLVEAIRDCDEAISIDPQFVKVYTRKGRALLKLGQITEASDCFCYVLSWQPKGPETNTSQEGDRFGKDLARQAMKQVILAKTLRDRLVNSSCGNNKQMLQTAEELLSLCPYMRLAQSNKAQALCLLRKWAEAKSFMELCICSIHHTMQELHSHPAADLSLVDSQCLHWSETGYNSLQVDVDSVVAAVLAMGPDMAKWYLMSLKNQDICRTSCSAESMVKFNEIVSRCTLLTTFEDNQDWNWLIEAEKQIRTMISLKNEADEKFRTNLFMEAIHCYTQVLEVDENAYIWNAIMFGNRAASSMRLGLFNEAVSDCHQSLARDEFYSRAYLRRARAHRALGNHTGSIRDYRKYLKFDPKPVDWQAVEEELLEVLRSKNDDERFQRAAPGWTNNPSTNSSSSSSSSSTNRSNKPFASEKTSDFTSSSRAQSDWNPNSDAENRQSTNKEKRKSTTSSSSSSSSSSTHKNPQTETNNNSRSQSKGPIVADVTSTNFYHRLGVDSHATEQEIKTAYRKLALKYHPDKNCSDNAADIFKSITEAYNQISDRSTRRTYDETLVYQHRSSRGGRRGGGH